MGDNKMEKQILPRVKIKDWEGMNIINSLMYHKEELKKVGTSQEKIKILKKRFNELKLELKNYQAA
jgi:hypothetical protein